MWSEVEGWDVGAGLAVGLDVEVGVCFGGFVALRLTLLLLEEEEEEDIVRLTRSASLSADVLCG